MFFRGFSWKFERFVEQRRKGLANESLFRILLFTVFSRNEENIAPVVVDVEVLSVVVDVEVVGVVEVVLVVSVVVDVLVDGVVVEVDVLSAKKERRIEVIVVEAKKNSSHQEKVLINVFSRVQSEIRMICQKQAKRVSK